MRILFCATPGIGHVEPLLPLMAALHRRGHALAWAGAAETHERVQACARLRCFEAGPGRHTARAELLTRWPELASAYGPPAASRVYSHLFGNVIGPAMLPGLLRAAQAFAPQLVVSETAALAAPLAAQLVGCKQVTHGLGMPLSTRQLQEAALVFAPAWQAATGEPAPPDAKLYHHLYLDVYPASLQATPLSAPWQPLQACNVQGPRPALWPALQAGLDHQPEGPLAYLSFGTEMYRPELLLQSAQALMALRLRVVVTVGLDADTSVLQPLLHQVHVARYIPQRSLLPHCALVVSLGGSGIVLGGWAQGLPQLVLPQRADQFINAAALQRSGAGLALSGPDQHADAIGHSLERLLEEPEYRSNAARLAREIAAMPSADAVAEVLEQL